MEKVRQWLRQWLGIEDAGIYERKTRQLWEDTDAKVTVLEGRIDDLEAAYPDYNKAKEQAEENKSKEIVPGFRPFTQRKRAWEAQHRKPTEKK